jgi:hypothetical protein
VPEILELLSERVIERNRRIRKTVRNFKEVPKKLKN